MIELWRGNANAWECDELGHLNVRFYLAKGMQAVANLAAASGLSDAYCASATATLIPQDIHIRFLAEARPGAPLLIRGGFLDVRENEADLVLAMRHGGDDRLAATLRLTLAHADPRSGRIFPWPSRFRARAETLKTQSPKDAAPRGVTSSAWEAGPSLERADALGLETLGRGRFGVEEMDVFGRLRPEFLLGRVSDSVVHFAKAFPEEAAFHAGKTETALSGALLETRIGPRSWPRAGDGYVVRSGLRAANEKVRMLVHWVLDPESGRPWWTMEGVACAMNLEARRLAPAQGEILDQLHAAIIPDLNA